MKETGKRFWFYGVGLSLTGALLFLGFVYKPSADVGTLVSCADMQMRMGRFLLARETTTKVLAQDPHHLQARLIDAYCAERLLQYDDAITTYSLILKELKDPEQISEIKAAMSLLEINRQKPTKGLLWLGDFRGANERLQAKFDFLQGSCREDLKEIEQAIALYKKVLDNPHAEIEILSNASHRMEILGFPEEALKGYQRGIEANDLESKYLFARLKFFNGETDMASAVLREISTKDSRFLGVRLRADDEFRKVVQSFGPFPGVVPGDRKH